MRTLTNPFLLLTISVLLLASTSLYPPDRTTTEKPKYSEVVSDFLDNLERRYGDSMHVHAWNGHDSVREVMMEAQFDNFSFTDHRGETFDLASFGTPILFEASASWCGPCQAAVPALKEFARTYRDSVKVVVVLHDRGKYAKAFAEKLGENIYTVIPDEQLESMNAVKLNVGKFQHLFSFPTAYYLDAQLEVLEIRSGGPDVGNFVVDGKEYVTTQEDANQRNIAEYRRVFGL